MKISPPTGNQLAMAVCSRYDGHQSLLLALYVTMLQHELQITASISWFTEAHQVSDGGHSWCSCWGFPSQVKRSSSIDDGSKISIISNLKFSNFKCIPNLSKYYNIDRNSHSHQKAIKLKLRRKDPAPSHVEGEPTQGHPWPRQPGRWTKMEYGIVQYTPATGFWYENKLWQLDVDGVQLVFIDVVWCCMMLFGKSGVWCSGIPLFPTAMPSPELPTTCQSHRRSFERVQASGPTQLRWTKKRLQNGWFTSRSSR